MLFNKYHPQIIIPRSRNELIFSTFLNIFAVVKLCRKRRTVANVRTARVLD